MKRLNGIVIHDPGTLTAKEKRREYLDLVNTINLRQMEDYDCSEFNVWSYRQKDDIRDCIPLNFGNMTGGFPVSINHVQFFTSEAAYIAGNYASKDEHSIFIQGLIAAYRNGLWCKKTFRRTFEYTQYERKDFFQYNIQWMMHVIHQKVSQNEDFANMLQQIPIDAHIVENTSYHRPPKTGIDNSIFWGAKNQELEKARQIATAEVAEKGSYKSKQQLRYAQILAANAINEIGHFIGKNCMGKMIKVASRKHSVNPVF